MVSSNESTKKVKKASLNDAQLLVGPRASKFVNYLMRNGKKNIAQKMFLDMMQEIKQAGHINPQSVRETALENASPTIMTKSKRIWGAVYQVPLEVKPEKKLFFSSTWIIGAAKSKKGKPMYKKLAEEVLAAYNNQWNAIKKKEDAHRMAEANKAFAHMAKYIK
jgi:small subunit ribosomal protein S7